MTSLNADSERLLKLIFGADWQRAWVCWKSDMGGGRAWTVSPPAGDDTYFSVGLMHPNAKTRSNDNVETVHALVFDDVGTKVDRDGMQMLAPEPDWKIQTSKGNAQYGFVIDGGCSRAEFEALRAAIKSHPVWGHSEGVDAVHLFRLPQGRNTKPGKGFDLAGNILFPSSGARHMRDVNELLTLFRGSGQGSGAPQGSGAQGSDADEINETELLGEIVGMIPNAGTDRQEWVDVAHAVWGASGGSSEEIFDAWSATWSAGTNDPAANAALWASIKGSKIGRTWLIRKAGETDPQGLAAWSAKEAAGAFDDGLDVVMGSADAVGVGQADAVQGMVAASIVRTDGEAMRYNHDNGCWHVFSSGVWQQMPGKHKAGFLKSEEWGRAHAGRLGKQQYKDVMKAGFHDGVENILRQRLSIRQADFDRDKWLLGTPGGTVDLRTGVLRPAYPHEYISKTTSVAPAGVAVGCPRWERFIHEICRGDAEAKRFLQQWLGYCLTGDTTEQVFLFLYGPGGNGKSVLMDTAAAIMGGYYRKPVADLYFAKTTSRHMQEVAFLAGARLITVSEVPPNAEWDEGKLKDHTGGGMITANFMRENSFSFMPQFKLTALGNHQPTFPGGMNAAIKRRFKLLPLNYVPPVVDPDLMAKFEAEAPGILRWMIEGLTHPQWGWHQTRLSFPQVMADATAAFVHDQDILGLWIETRTEKAVGTNTPATDLFNDWLEFRAANGGGALYGTPHTFAPEMVARGFRKLKLIKNNAYADIKLVSEARSAF